ncbi:MULTISPECIES: NAD(P)H nitroreductase [Basfia]|uniref:Putative NAD(P)H nitroreductase n=1 Tax=Mannheimia succiniciproducens (strain KCTC 0769BP / MBEL55E) TaxID=221988 RepID=Q65TJ4_MANSM|nr:MULTISPECIES: NAD(P)H nitroreductase [Basfia]AAU37716.1 NfnB protein [[Mannheimia] succiniciproducens MBEL55E]SEP75389.1 Nitroreductase [Basfia succiniciproducens]
MDALTLLTTRRSEKKLSAPVPNNEQLELIFQAATHVPDHGKLQPYHFIVIENDGLKKLETLLKSAVTELKLDEKRLQKAEKIASTAPMMIAVVAKINTDIAKVPAWEQMLSAGCSAYAMQLAANAQGFDNVWVTGPWVDGSDLREALGCAPKDKVIGFIILGTSQEKITREPKTVKTENFVSYL